MRYNGNYRVLWVGIACFLIAIMGIAATPVLALLLIHSALRTPEALNSQCDAPTNLPVWRWSLAAAIMSVAISNLVQYILSERTLQTMLEIIRGRYLLATPISRDFEFTFAGVSLHLFGQLSLLVGDVLLFKAFLSMQHPHIDLKQRIIKINSTAVGDTIGTLMVRTAVLLCPALLSFLIVYFDDFKLSVASSLGILPALAYPLLACISLSFMLAAAISAAQLLNRTLRNGDQQ